MSLFRELTSGWTWPRSLGAGAALNDGLGAGRVSLSANAVGSQWLGVSQSASSSKSKANIRCGGRRGGRRCLVPGLETPIAPRSESRRSMGGREGSPMGRPNFGEALQGVVHLTEHLGRAAERTRAERREERERCDESGEGKGKGNRSGCYRGP